MKKLFMLSASVLLLTTIASAQNEVALKSHIKKDERRENMIKKDEKKTRKALKKLEGDEVSYQAKEAFREDFGDIPVSSWRRTANYDEAKFMKDGHGMTAYYDADARLVGTTTFKTFADLPLSARKYINRKYKDYTKGDVVYFDDNQANETDMVLYDNQFDDEDIYFIELQKDAKKIVLQVSMDGSVGYFTTLR